MPHDPLIMPLAEMPLTERVYGEGAPAPSRPLWTAIGRGIAKTCPACGRGRLFCGYLKAVETCAACGEDLSHQRADDAPPYVTIVIVGHIVLGSLVTLDSLNITRPLWLDALLWPALTLFLALALLPCAKGAIIGLQWALKMHGFSGTADEASKF